MRTIFYKTDKIWICVTERIAIQRCLFVAAEAVHLTEVSTREFLEQKNSVAKAVISNCSFVANQAKEGGSVFVYPYKLAKRPVNVLVTNTKFTHNSVSTKGGSWSVDGNWPTDMIKFYNCTFINNSAHTFGGAMVLSRISSKIIG